MDSWDIQLTWYSKADFDRIKKFIDFNTNRLVNGEAEHDPFCYRGLETPSQRQQRMIQQKKAVQAVLLVQKDKIPDHHNAAVKETEIAKVYNTFSVPARRQSSKIGRMDAMAIFTTEKNPNPCATTGSTSRDTMRTEQAKWRRQVKKMDPPASVKDYTSSRKAKSRSRSPPPSRVGGGVTDNFNKSGGGSSPPKTAISPTSGNFAAKFDKMKTQLSRLNLMPLGKENGSGFAPLLDN